MPNLFLQRSLGMQRWRSGKSTRLPPMWPRFDFQIQRHVGWVCWFSALHWEVFSGCSGFPSPQKPAFDLIWFVLIIHFSLQCPQLVLSARAIKHSNKVPFLSFPPSSTTGRPFFCMKGVVLSWCRSETQRFVTKCIDIKGQISTARR